LHTEFIGYNFSTHTLKKIHQNASKLHFNLKNFPVEATTLPQTTLRSQFCHNISQFWIRH